MYDLLCLTTPGIADSRFVSGEEVAVDTSGGGVGVAVPSADASCDLLMLAMASMASVWCDSSSQWLTELITC